MRHILEKAIVHILNGDQDKAEALFHKFMVEKARQIHESLRQGEDVELNENWDSEIKEEEYFDNTDLDDEGTEVADVGDPAASPVDGDEGAPSVDAEAEMSDVMDDEGGDEFADDDTAPEAGGDMESKIDDIQSQMDELTSEFDRLMAKLDDDTGDDSLDDMGDDESLDDMGSDDMGDVEDEGVDDVTDMGMGGEEPSDIAGRMEDDMGDEDQPEHEMAEEEMPEIEEDDEMLEDITESVLAELDKIANPLDGKGEGSEIGSGGKKMSPHNSSILPNHDVDQRWQQAKPVMVKAEGDAHNDSFERETSPPTKEVTRRRNNDAGVKKLEKVPSKGDNSALINKDFTTKPSTQSIIDGKAKKG